MRRPVRLLLELVGPLGLVVATAIVGSQFSVAQQTNVVNVLVTTTIVVGLYVFIGNSGVMSFGQVSFVAVGAFAAGVLTNPPQLRRTTMPQLFGVLATPQLTNLESLLLAAGLGALFAFLVGLALMRLSGLGAGIATFAVLEITYNILGFWDKIGPAATTLSLVPVTTGLLQGGIGCGIAVVVAFVYQHTRSCRLLRASREDRLAAIGIGVPIFRHRLGAFTLSGAICGFAGSLFVHELGSINVNQVYLSLTFSTLAMLVVGGVGSLWGATIGGIGLGALSAFLSNAENGVEIGSLHLTLPNGLDTVIFGALMAGTLIVAPGGVARGREFLAGMLSPSRRTRPRAPAQPVAETGPPLAGPPLAG